MRPTAEAPVQRDPQATRAFLERPLVFFPMPEANTTTQLPQLTPEVFHDLSGLQETKTRWQDIVNTAKEKALLLFKRDAPGELPRQVFTRTETGKVEAMTRRKKEAAPIVQERLDVVQMLTSNNPPSQEMLLAKLGTTKKGRPFTWSQANIVIRNTVKQLEAMHRNHRSRTLLPAEQQTFATVKRFLLERETLDTNAFLTHAKNTLKPAEKPKTADERLQLRWENKKPVALQSQTVFSADDQLAHRIADQERNPFRRAHQPTEMEIISATEPRNLREMAERKRDENDNESEEGTNNIINTYRTIFEKRQGEVQAPIAGQKRLEQPREKKGIFGKLLPAAGTIFSAFSRGA